MQPHSAGTMPAASCVNPSVQSRFKNHLYNKFFACSRQGDIKEFDFIKQGASPACRAPGLRKPLWFDSLMPLALGYSQNV